MSRKKEGQAHVCFVLQNGTTRKQGGRGMEETGILEMEAKDTHVMRTFLIVCSWLSLPPLDVPKDTMFMTISSIASFGRLSRLLGPDIPALPPPNRRNKRDSASYAARSKIPRESSWILHPDSHGTSRENMVSLDFFLARFLGFSFESDPAAWTSRRSTSELSQPLHPTIISSPNILPFSISLFRGTTCPL